MLRQISTFFLSAFITATILFSTGAGINMLEAAKFEQATLGGGCFWCVEAVYLRMKGVHKVVSGYAGGHVHNPSYEQVSAGRTGHAEVIQISYDPSVVSYVEILEVFFKTHDPTTLNRQGNDVGTQYRSIILYHNDKQKKVAQDIIEKLSKQKIYRNPIVTEIEPLTNFYKAEDYHQNYYNQNKNKPYCVFVITPKVDKFEKIFKDKLK